MRAVFYQVGSLSFMLGAAVLVGKMVTVPMPLGKKDVVS